MPPPRSVVLPFDELTDEELQAAVDHARTNAAQRQTSPEYRKWWTARADHLESVLKNRGGK